MIREITLSKYPHEVRLAVRWAARFLTRIDLPIHQKLGHVRFTEALREGFAKLEEPARHEAIPTTEAWALRIVVNFAIAQVREVHQALHRLRQELRGVARPRRRQARTAKVNAG
jgi:hypothetical protein